jgi:exodeoxyribonuclease-1
VEQSIYDGFPSRDDEEAMSKFHSTDWDERLKLLENIADKRACELGRRLIYLEQPDLLPKSLRRQHDEWLKERILNSDPAVPWMTVPKALEEVESLISDSESIKEKKFLQDVKVFVRDLRRRIS